MNYLAHVYLSANEPGNIIGNLTADFLKGPAPATTPATILEGHTRHRRIDRLTDGHPAFLRSRQRLSPELQRYGGVIVDVIYDHFLAVNWAEWSPATLPTFSTWAYDLLENHHHWLPPRFQVVLPRMRAGDWLGSYCRTSSIELALRRLSDRARRDVRLHDAIADLEKHYGGLEDDFREVFTALLAAVEAESHPVCGRLPADALSRLNLPAAVR